MTSLSPPSDVWVSPRVIVSESPIEGRGLFAAEPIALGTRVIQLGGRLVDSGELNALIDAANQGKAAYADTIAIDQDVHLVLPPATLAHFGNHSCEPNLWHDGPFDLVARRDISASEELTLDYGTNSGADGFTMQCDCGDPHCRGQVTSEDWRLPDLQHRYEGHWTPALQRRISSA
jgi:hypothetical protein